MHVCMYVYMCSGSYFDCFISFSLSSTKIFTLISNMFLSYRYYLILLQKSYMALSALHELRILFSHSHIFSLYCDLYTFWHFHYQIYPRFYFHSHFSSFYCDLYTFGHFIIKSTLFSIFIHIFSLSTAIYILSGHFIIKSTLASIIYTFSGPAISHLLEHLLCFINFLTLSLLKLFSFLLLFRHLMPNITFPFTVLLL